MKTKHLLPSEKCPANKSFRRAWPAAFAAAALFTAAPHQATAATLTVTNLNDSGIGSLREAITTANATAGSTVVFQAGLRGAITLATELPPISASMTIKGPGSSLIAVDGAGKYRPFSVETGGAAVSILNLTVQNGNDQTTAGGGALYVYNSSLAVTSCVFKGNQASAAGGGIENYGSSLSLSGSTLSNNSAGGHGGALSNEGGGIATIVGCTLSGNNASADSGGGIYNEGTLAVSKSSITGNGATYGGGLYNNSPGADSVALNYCTISGNTGSSAAGGIFNNIPATLNLMGCTLSSNSSPGSGAGIANIGLLGLSNCTFYGNVSGSGGGGGAVYTATTATFTNCTITNNSAGYGGGLYSDGWNDPSSGNIILANCILYGNHGDNGTDYHQGAWGFGHLSANYSDIAGGFGGTGNIDKDPALDPAGLANNGGTTQTIALAFLSPCYRAGSAIGAPLADQRGVSRPAQVSIGAYDYGTPLGTVATPAISPNGGTVAIGSAIAITDVTAGSAIYYSTDGSIPADTSNPYVNPIPVGTNETITAIAVLPGYYISPSASATFVAVKPTITGFSPTFGPAGTVVTIKGTYLAGATSVTFNGVKAAITSATATQIVTAAPAGVTTGKISVVVGGGTIISANDFFAAPTITVFSPTAGPAGAIVTIKGTNFTGVTSVKFNGTAASITSSTATQIITSVPAGVTTGKITVTTPGGTTTSAGNFTAPPTILGFTPPSGQVGATITIKGTNLADATSVKFNGTADTTFTIVSATSITATVPAGATTGRVTVITPGGTAISSADFKVTATIVPALKAFTLSPATIAAGDSITATVTLTSPAPSGGVVVPITQGPFVFNMLPIPAGQSSASFTIATTPGAPSGTYSFTAAYAGKSITATVTVN